MSAGSELGTGEVLLPPYAGTLDGQRILEVLAPATSARDALPGTAEHDLGRSALAELDEVAPLLDSISWEGFMLIQAQT